MKRSVDLTPARPASGRRSWKELWKRLLTEDELDSVHAGGESSPISVPGPRRDQGGDP